MDWKLDPEVISRRGKNAASDTLVDDQDTGLVWEHEATTKDGRTFGRVGKVGQLLRQQVYDCTFCEGTGIRCLGGSLGGKCPVCKGRLTVRVQPPAMICAYCKGSGEEIRRSALTCSVCKGKGVVSVKEPIKICPTCRGRGRPVGVSLYCGTCKGKGVVTVKILKEGETPTIRRPSGSEWEAFQIIHELGQAGRHGVGAGMHVGAAYADYVLKSLLKKGLIERASRDMYVLSEVAEKAFTKRLEEEERKKNQKMEAEKMEKKEVKVKPIDTQKLQEYKIL